MTLPASPSPSSSSLAGKTVVLGVTGGIAAYKAAELVRLLGKAGARVRVVMTAAAQRFITPLTLQTLSGHPVATDLFDPAQDFQESQIGHIQLADGADLLLIAPATADMIGKLAHGLADDLLSTVALACRAPLLLAPAMNVNMWRHPQVRANLRTLVERGARTCGPDAGELACGWVGEGRLVDPPVIVEAAAAALAAGDLAGRHLLISAGPTFEAIDPVRFIGNRSSGKMGFALAAAAARRGARVTLVAGPVALPTPPGVTRVDVESAAEMAAAVLDRAAAGGGEAVDAVIMAAAVADYRPAAAGARKLKKEALGAAPTIALLPTVDILRELGRRRAAAGQPAARRPVLIGFAAETDDVEAHAGRKLADKACDLIIANDVAEAGSGFGADTNRVTLLSAGPPGVERLPQLPKAEVAGRILDRLAALLAP